MNEITARFLYMGDGLFVWSKQGEIDFIVNALLPMK